MTFSIVACDLSEPAWGVAVASKFPAVGAVVPWARAGAGAVATQSFANPTFGPRGLDLMAGGMPPEETLRQLLDGDPDRETRQVGLVNASGQSATFSGSACLEWAGGVTGDGYAIQGNVLSSSRVVPEMEKVFRETAGDLPARLYAALLAGDRAGGDRRGRQSAAIYVAKPGGGYGGLIDRWMDYRVDDHPDPVMQLGELIEMHRLYFGKSPEAERVLLAAADLERVRVMLHKLGYLDTGPAGELDDATREAFAAFIGNENFEERADPSAGWVDRPVLAYLYRKFEG